MITVVGEALIDLVDVGSGGFRAIPGGSPFNVAIASSRLGVPTRLFARLSSDRFGSLLRSFALANSVDLSAAVAAAEPTSLAVTSVDALGRASYDFYVSGTADWNWHGGELRGIGAGSIVHFGSIASWTPPGSWLIRSAVSRTSGLVTYDPNVRPLLIGSSRQRVAAAISRNVAVADVVKASDEDLAWLYPSASPAEVASLWLSGRPSLVIVTSGSSGATAYRAGASPVHQSAYPVSIVDTVGAGDAFMGALLAGLHRAGGLAGVDLASLLDQAALAAALTSTREGADPPTASELESARLPA